jgi:serine/threonine-protein kinase
MEYIEGESLSQKLSGRPLPEREAACLIRTLARAMHLAHCQQIIHRDLKPANVLIRADGVVKLTDFGLAKLLDTEDGQTQSYAIMGTASYMAPEQARGQTRHVGPLADVYGLGAILYECLTGQPPFRSSSRQETLEQVKSQPPVLPSRLGQRPSPSLEAICLKCLEKTPSQRYPSAEALADDLDRWLRGEPTVARPPSWPRRIGHAARRHRVVTTVAVLGVLALAAAALVWTFTNPVRPVNRIEKELACGREVELIGHTGNPRWFRWRLGEGSSQISLAGDGAFSVYTEVR